MKHPRTHSCHVFEALESRRLLSFAPFGAGAAFANGHAYPSSDTVVAADGSYGVVYCDGAGVKLARFTSTGGRVGQPLTILDKPRWFSAAGDSAGNVVVAYGDSSNADGLADQLWIRRVSSAGVLSAPQLVNSATQGHSDPAVSMDPTGRFFVGWVEITDSGEDLFARAFNANGTPRAAKFAVDPTAPFREFATYFTLTAKPDGAGVEYAYIEYGADGWHQDLRFGGTTTTADAGNVKVMTFMHGAKLATYADGSFVMTYATTDRINSSADDGPSTTFVQRFNADGTPRSGAVQIGTTLAGAGLGVDPLDVAPTPDGGFVVTYIHAVDGTNERTLFAQRFDKNGKSDDAGPVDFYSANPANNGPGAPVPGARTGLGIDAAGNAVVSYGLTAPEVDFLGTFTTHAKRLTSAIAAIDNSTLWVLGTRRSEAMSVKKRGGSLFANIGNTSMKFAASRVKGIAIEGSNGNDRIFNETAIPSTIRGGSGDDLIQGGSGNDLIRGNNGDDDLNGNDGNDELFGDAGNDYLAGNNGNDRLDGGSGRDRIYGYAGNDSIFANDGELDQLYGNGGRDTFDRDREDGVID